MRDLVLDILSEVMEGEDIILWMYSPNRMLRGKTPNDLIEGVESQDVADAARSEVTKIKNAKRFLL